MKPLENLINVEKARLLHELFPQEIPALLEYINSICLTIQEDEQLLHTQWNSGLFTIETWLYRVVYGALHGFIHRYAKA